MWFGKSIRSGCFPEKKAPEIDDRLEIDFPAPRNEPFLAKFKKGDAFSSLPKNWFKSFLSWLNPKKIEGLTPWPRK